MDGAVPETLTVALKKPETPPQLRRNATPSTRYTWSGANPRCDQLDPVREIEQAFEARPTGVERADATIVRIPIESSATAKIA